MTNLPSNRNEILRVLLLLVSLINYVQAFQYNRMNSVTQPVGSTLLRNDYTTRNQLKKILSVSNEPRQDDVVLDENISEEKEEQSLFKDAIVYFQEQGKLKPPPIQIEDTNLLFYDVFLIINLSLSISFWAVHRMDFNYIGSALSEGSLLSILWIAAGLYNGAFLKSAVDAHYGSTDERGGPKAAGFLGFKTFLDTVNLRLVTALIIAFIQHRPVGVIPEEQLIPLEVCFGFVLMSVWRVMHSYYTPRI